ncbi:MAG: hypothetical protein J7M18_01250 [Candidatus Eremiobacteraeota bacterium]|nr:hypothetical protein [Candidatus Eremiobacteraeota bacterium]
MKIEITSGNFLKIDDMEINPSRSPAVIPTLTWNEQAVSVEVGKYIDIFKTLANAYNAGNVKSVLKENYEKWKNKINFFLPSLIYSGQGKTSVFILGSIIKGQRILINISTSPDLPEMRSIKKFNFDIGGKKIIISIIPADYQNTVSFISGPGKIFAPRALGPVKRLGIGNRMTTLVWPALYKVAEENNLRANLIQNSVYRELAPLKMIVSRDAEDTAYLPGLGKLSVGHTGTSIEGLWLYGVISAIENGFTGDYGADADHIPVKQGKKGIEKARELIEISRHYTFFTLDTSARFNSKADTTPIHDLQDLFEQIPDCDKFLKRYSEKFTIKSTIKTKQMEITFSPEEIMRISLKFHQSISAINELDRYIRELKGDENYDLEISLDECPGLTTIKELFFILNELDHLGVKITHIAPNVGFEKRLDYRLPDGLEGLKKRVADLATVAGHFGVILDFHSGSDKSPATYHAISEATCGNLHLKVSGILQLIYAETLQDMMPDFFKWWWNWSLDYAKKAVQSGNEIAKKYIADLELRQKKEGDDFTPSAKDSFFKNFSYACIGIKDESGKFIYREKFYDIPGIVKEEYEKRIKKYITDLARDLGWRIS